MNSDCLDDQFVIIFDGIIDVYFVGHSYDTIITFEANNPIKSCGANEMSLSDFEYILIKVGIL